MNHDPRIGPNYTTADLQDLQLLQRQTRTALVVLESNEGTYTSLRRFYSEQVAPLLDRNLLTLQEAESCRQSLRQFISQLDELVYETNMHIKCLAAVEKGYSERMTLVNNHSSFEQTIISLIQNTAPPTPRCAKDGKGRRLERLHVGIGETKRE